VSSPDEECPHGFPPRYIKRCADCRRARRRAEEAARFRAALAALPDAARAAANDREDDDG
jgi:hypothetical protein